MTGIRHLKVQGKISGTRTIVRELTWEKGTVRDDEEYIEYYFFANEYPIPKEDFDERYEILSEIEL